MAEFKHVLKELVRYRKLIGMDDEPITLATSARSCTDEFIEGFEEEIVRWSKEHPKPQYPTWEEWLVTNGVMEPDDVRMNNDYRFYFKGKPVKNIPTEKMFCHIPTDIAERLGLKPKEV